MTLYATYSLDNGFYLKGADSSALGTDSSGNGNNFTAYQMRPTVPLTKATGA